MKFDLTESVVREYLRDHSGTAYCSDCVCKALDADVPPRAVSLVMAELAERRPPFGVGRCACGAAGLMYTLAR
jgi:hypothetical protein